MRKINLGIVLRLFLVFMNLACAHVLQAQTVTMDGVTYEVTSATEKTACCYAANKDITSAIIRANVEIDGVTYKVTEITQGKAWASRKYVAKSGFSTCLNLKSVEFEAPTNLTEIPYAAFNFCESLISIDIPQGITKIGDAAIAHCVNLVAISLPNTVEYLGSHFVCSCRSLVSLVIPNSVKYIDGAFLHGCESLRSVYLLGDPAALAPGDAFVANGSWGGHVNNCTFYVNNEETYKKYLEAQTGA